MKRSAIIVAAGSGVRTGLPFNKIFLDLGGMPVIGHAISRFDSHPQIDEIIVVGREDELQKIRKMVSHFGFSKVSKIVPGGSERQFSVLNGLHAAQGDIVLIHDAARPFLPKKVLDQAISIPDGYQGVLVALPAKDTIKMVTDEAGVIKTLDRKKIYLAQTPQVFWKDFILSAYEQCISKGAKVTDDAAVAEMCGGKIYIVGGSEINFKITTMEDVYNSLKMIGMVKVGHGYDIHAFAESEIETTIPVGGIRIPSKHKVIAHSDGDVVLHALMDAILGAYGKPDIGHFFPPDDPQYENANSCDLLKKVIDITGARVINVDITVIGKSPKISPYIESIRENIAKMLNISQSNVGIKATTNEGLDDIGMGKGIASHVVVLVENVPREWEIGG